MKKSLGSIVSSVEHFDSSQGDEMRSRHPRLASYHEGELAAQNHAGFRESANRLRPIIGDSLPRGVEGFLADLPFLVIGASSPSGEMWASILYGQPGFLRVISPGELSVQALLSPGDPLTAVLEEPVFVGMLAIGLALRRRLRINGRAVPVPGGLKLFVDQAYGNCPKYIQSRSPEPSGVVPSARLVSEGTALTTDQRKIIDSADTFFVASASAAGDADASHRGGDPGFIRSLSPNEIRWPDYEGNTMLMTLGNLTVNPAAGLVLIDWQAGTTLQLTGTATVDWNQHTAAAFPGAERMVDFQVSKVVQLDHPSGALSWSVPEYSRFNPPASPTDPDEA
jgi:predicted pyridoxine 5'-phosphate oxidase superfamily flavin-nucleotide-binding protein